MEECNENGDFSLAKKNYSIQLEEKIEEMRKTIEDLRQKVTEDREMLQKEKRENERLMEEVKLQRKLSMFHLPHCPAHSTPCPVHPFKKLSLHHDMGQYGTDSNDDLFHGDHTIGHSDHVTQSYKELVQNFKPQSRHGCEDLFVEHEAAPPQVEINSQPDSFTLLLSNQWCRQQSMAKAPQSLFEQKEHTSNKNGQFKSSGDTQYAILSDNFNNM